MKNLLFVLLSIIASSVAWGQNSVTCFRHIENPNHFVCLNTFDVLDAFESAIIKDVKVDTLENTKKVKSAELSSTARTFSGAKMWITSDIVEKNSDIKVVYIEINSPEGWTLYIDEEDRLEHPYFFKKMDKLIKRL